MVSKTTIQAKDIKITKRILINSKYECGKVIEIDKISLF